MEGITKAKISELFEKFYNDEFMSVSELESLLIEASVDTNPCQQDPKAHGKTIGISKETISKHIDRLHGCDGFHDRAVELSFCYSLLKECTELDPWLPIADAPKDGRELYLKENDTVTVGFWDAKLNIWYVHGMTPTHYKEIT